MQIHELNNFTGTLGAGAYLAVDDGNDTGKLSTQQLLAATEARIDNIIAGPAPSAQEVTDARLGADGVTYGSLGTAIRTQVGDLKSAINEIGDFTNLFDESAIMVGVQRGDGSINTEETNYWHTPLIDVEGLAVYFKFLQKPSDNYLRIGLYNENQTFVSRQLVTLSSLEYTFANTNKYKYIVVSCYTGSEDGFSVIKAPTAIDRNARENISALNTDVASVKNALLACMDEVTVSHTATVTPEAGYTWKVFIPKDSRVKFTNNCSVAVTLQVRKADGTAQTITTSVASGATRQFIAPFDVEYIRNYVGNTTAFSVEVAFITPIVDEFGNIDLILNGYPITAVGLTPIYLHQGDTIKIDVASNTVATNLFIDPVLEGEAYATIPVGSGVYEYVAVKDGYVKLQNTATSISATAYLETRYDEDIKNLEAQIQTGSEVYTVKKDGTGDYVSFVACLKDLSSNTNVKTIYVYDGVYDIYEENGGDDFIATITNPSGTNWREVNAIVPPNTKIIGCGNVQLRFAPSASQIGSNAMAFLFSPLNITGNCEIENISVYGTNCRYAIHDESSGRSTYNDSKHIYRNVRARKEHGTYGNDQVYASGFGSRAHLIFESCEFTSDRSAIWTTHTNPSNQNDLAEIIFNGCIFKVDNSDNASEIVQFIVGSSNNAAIENIVKINSCAVMGSISVYTNETPNTVANKFNVTALKSTVAGGITVSENFSSNPYPPTIYN